MKKKKPIYLITGVLIMILFYLMASCMAWSLIPGDWNANGREVFSFFEFVIFLTSIMLFANSKRNS